MNINKYTEKAQEAMLAAQQLADREGHPEMLPEHLLLALVEQKDGIVPTLVRKLNADPSAIAAGIRAELNRQPRAHGDRRSCRAERRAGAGPKGCLWQARRARSGRRRVTRPGHP